MRTRPDPRATYRARRKARAAAVALQRRSVDRISNLRLLTGLAGLGLGVAVWRDALAAAWLLVPVVAFVALVVVHERAHRALHHARRAVAHYRAGQRRLDDAWAGHGPTGEGLLPAEHLFAADLDLLGPGSLFELLCTARTSVGRRTLAGWLLAPATVPVVRRRQAAVEDLREHLDLREALDLAGDELDRELDPSQLVAWGHAPPAIPPDRAGRWRALAFGIPALTAVAVAVLLLVGRFEPLAAALLATWGVGRLTGRVVRSVHMGSERSAQQLEVLARVLACLERERFEDEGLEHQRARLVGAQGSASARIRGLARMLGWAEASRSQIFFPVAFVLLWDLHFALALERWRLRHGPAIEAWLEALGELEALACLSAYAFEHPDDPFPELHEGEPLLEGEHLGHPLLPSAQCVRNPVSLGGSVPARIVSGSNMSGKSTYLRTVGINVVLALAGAPVRARSLRLSRLRIGATLRVQDSLRGGASRFFAEITRLRQIVAAADEGPGVLFLIDEILHGTNSHDRRRGGHAIVHGLLDRGALGLVTTHDLALAEGNDDPRIANVHFRDELRQGELSFDYRMHAGVVRTSNALALMEAVGLPVPATEPDP